MRLITKLIILMKPFLIAFFLCFLFFHPFHLFTQNVLPDALDGEIYVKFENDYPLNIQVSKSGDIDFRRLPYLMDFIDKYGITRVYKSFYFADNYDLQQTLRVTFDKVDAVEVLLRELNAISFIEYAEPVPFLQSLLTPNDLHPPGGSPNQWGLHKINAQQAWDISTGDPNIAVAIVDDAVQTDHPDLAANMLPGWDVADNNNNPNPPNTQYSHGTHVAGIAGAVTDNGIGIASIGWNISILPVKATNSTSNITHGYEGVVWAANNGADVINMSWGGAQSNQTALNVINAAYNNGIVLVAAAGNSGHQGNPVFYPAGYNNVIAVANTTSTDEKATSSQYGAWIDVSAPGTAILSTYPFDSYGNATGTSMSSPLVAGLCGLMLSLNPALTPLEIKNCLMSSCDNIDAQNPSYIGQLGAGRINAYQAMLCVSATINPLDAGIKEIIYPAPVTCSPQITPVVLLRNYGLDTLYSVDINYSVNGGTLHTYNWTGTLLSWDETQVTLAPLNVPTAGSHTFLAYTENPNGGTDNNNANDSSTAVFNYFTSSMPLPFTEDFESGSFATNSWSIHNPDNSITWDIVTTQGTTPGDKAARMEHYTYTSIGQRNSMLTPPLNFAGYSSIELTFEHAYRRFDQSSTDSLLIYVSTDCGQSFPHKVFAGGEDGTGSFATAATSQNPFTPSVDTEWCIAGTVGAPCFTVDLSPFIGNQNVIIKFESFNSNQNNLFLDNINIDGVQTNVPPNPDFSASPTQICAGDTVFFTDLSAPSASSWQWTFPGGTPATSTDQHPVVEYHTAGSYSVTLEATNSAGSNTVTHTNLIIVDALPPQPVITQNGSILSTAAGGASFQWYFNNSPIPGSNSSSITASTPGDYIVEVTNSAGCKAMSLPYTFTGSNPNDAGVVHVETPSNVSCTGSIVPEVRIRNFGGQSLSSVVINYTVNGGVVNTYNWSGNLATNDEENVILPPISVPSGPHVFTAYTSLPNGTSDSNTANDTLSSDFTVYNIGLPLPFSEDFQSGSFSTNNWVIENPDDDITWEIVQTDCTFPGNRAAFMNFFNYTATGQRDAMISPPLDFSGYSTVTLDFDHAYRRHSGTATDSLFIYISTDCGATFPHRVFVAGEDGTGLLATGYTTTSNFTPADSSDWCMGPIGASCFSVDLSAFAGNPSVIIKFESYNNYQNNLYIDNINIEGIALNDPPVADFTADFTTIFAGGNVNFSDLSTNNPTSWSWIFAGGTPATSTDQNPTQIVYDNPGTYDVTLQVSNAYGPDTEHKVGYINVLAGGNPPAADFVANQTQIYAGDTVHFNDLSTDNPTSWYWMFPGATPATSTDQNPTNIVYDTPGTYDVTLQVENAYGNNTETKVGYIIVSVPGVPPHADFVANPTSVNEGGTVSFIDMSSNNPSSWEWIFPGGTPATSYTQNPSIIYNTAGTYDVTLKVYNTYGGDTLTKNAYITVTVSNNIPVADFVASETTVVAGNSISFTDLSANTPTSWDWTFNGGTPAVSPDQNPSNIVYDTPGTYDVTLEVSNSYGSDIETKTAYITVVSPSDLPVADFEANQTNITAGQSVNFTDLSTNSPTAWSWSFSGGTPTTSPLQNPSNITYNTPGVYDVTLVVTNSYGSDTEIKTGYIIVTAINNAPIVDFEANITMIPEGSTVDFTDLSTNNPNSWLWAFEGATPSSSTDQNPTDIYYSAPGTYYVTLIATNTAGTGFLNKESYITVTVGSSVDEVYAEESVSVYPNPTNEKVFIDIISVKENFASVKMHNLLGQLVVEKIRGLLPAGKNTFEIDVTKLPKGAYFIEVDTQEDIHVYKIIVL